MAPRSFQPAFIVAAPRSGSTLLRLVLDAHREIGCPGETGLPGLAAQFDRTWATICNDLEPGRTGELPAGALRAMRRALRAPMEHYCRETGKRVYCDKSLEAAVNLGPIGRLFPRARYILLYRHVFDVIASGLDASPWGFRHYGYLPYVRNSADNFVAPLVTHWIAHVRPALEWQSAHPSQCHSVRYEDLVADPDGAFAAIFEFLEVDPDPSASARALRSAPDARTFGDANIGFTTEIHSDSIGRGRRVPLSLVPPLLLAEANELLAMLGYPRVGADWNFDTAMSTPPVGSPNTVDLELLAALMPSRVDPRTLASGVSAFSIELDDGGGSRWVVNAASGLVLAEAQDDVEISLHGTAAAWVHVLQRNENPARMFRDGRLRVRGAGDEERLRAVTLLIRALQASVAP